MIKIIVTFKEVMKADMTSGSFKQLIPDFNNFRQYEPYLAKLKQGHRRLIEGNFKIVYRVEGDIIYVVDFFDSREDSKKMKG